MLSFDNHHYAKRLEGFLDAVAYLLRHAFLYLETVREAIHYAGYLAQACYLSVGDVCHVYLAIEGQHVVFAKGIEIDVSHDDHLAVVLVELS